MGKIQLDHTGSGSGITLSSDGTSLLLDGTAVGGGGASDYTRATKTANYTVVAGDLGKIIDVTSNSVTITLTAAATLGDGFYVFIRNSSSTATHVVTIDANGSETIDGSPLIYLRRYEGIHLVCDGSGFFSLRTRVDGLQTNMAQQSNQNGQPTATGSNALALGGQTDATANFATAIGYQAQAGGESSISVGRGTNASGDNSVALGAYNTASGATSVAIGGTSYTTSATSSHAIALGSGARSAGSGAIAGPYSYASGYRGVSLGVDAFNTTYGAQGSNSIAIGQLAKATAANSIAIGDTATSTTANLIALGGTTDTVKISGAYTLPTSDGSANQVLTTNGSGVVTFADAPASDLVNDTSPQLGGNLDVQAREINTSTTNGNIVFNPNGTGVVEVKGAGGNDGTLQLNCSANSHGVKIKSPPHSAGASYTLTLPNDDGDASEFLQTNGSGVLTWAAAGADLYAANPSSATDPVASGTNAVAIGTVAVASGSLSTAVGHGALASAANSFAGPVSNSSGVGSVALGIGTNSTSYGATGNYSFAVGYQSKATGSNAIAIGDNAVSSSSGSVAIGEEATATGYNTFAVGKSRASATGATALNIENSSSSYGASNPNSFAVGDRAKATGYNSTAIGDMPIASNHYATSIGRQTNATALYSTALGFASKSSIYGKLAYASGYFFSTYGDAQGGQFILRGNTTDATAKVLTTDNEAVDSDNQVIANSDTCISFDGTITAMQNGAQAYGSWKIEGLLVNDGGTTTLANSAITVIQNSSNWGLALSADNTNNALAITCTGEANHNIRWVANIRTSEVTYA